MTTHRLAVAAAGALLAATASTAAAAPAEGPAGAPCALTQGFGPTVPEERADTLSGGPLLGSGTLTCTLQLGAATHDGADTASVRAVGGTVVVIWPVVVTYPYAGEQQYVCTSFTDARGRTLYRNGATGGWDDDGRVPCDKIVGYEDIQVHEVVAAVDAAVCPVFAQAAPGVPGVVDVSPKGDVDLLGEPFWFCPPYGP